MSRPDVLKAGDPAWLKSGGPEMTVTAVDEGVVYLAWFDQEEHLHMADLPRAVVETATERRRRQDGNLASASRGAERNGFGGGGGFDFRRIGPPRDPLPIGRSRHDMEVDDDIPF